MKIVALTKSRMNEMIALVKRVFPYETEEAVVYPIEGSLNINKKRNWKWLHEKECNWVKYFVLIDKGKVIGTTGIYTMFDDKNEAYWIAWYCLAPEMRGKGIGYKLLDFCIDKAKKAKKKYIRLYTSDHKNEMAANYIYDKVGFKLFKKEPDKELPGINILYKELKL